MMGWEVGGQKAHNDPVVASALEELRRTDLALLEARQANDTARAAFWAHIGAWHEREHAKWMAENA